MCSILQLLILLILAPQVAESAKDDISAQAGNPVAVQETPDPVIESSNLRLVSPGACEDAYIQHSAPLDLAVTPLMLAGDDRVYSDGSTLDSSVNIQRGGTFVHNEPGTKPDCDSDATRTVLGPNFQMLCTAPFSHLSRPRYASPPVTPDSACSQVYHIPSPGQVDLSASYTDDASNEPPNSLLFTEPMPVTFVRPVSPLPPSSPGFTNSYSMECSDDASAPPFPSLSSPVPSSSPPTFFTSSPTRYALYKSPPTSPVPTEKPSTAPSAVGSNPLKRPHSPDTVTTSVDDQGEGLGEEITKRRVRRVRFFFSSLLYSHCP